MLSKLFVILFIVVCINNVSTMLIKGLGSGRCIAVDGADTANGAKDVIWHCKPGYKNFEWIMPPSPTQDGYILKSRNADKCLAVAGESVEDGAEIIQWDCLDRPNFLWNMKPRSEGEYQLVGLQSKKCVAVDGGFEGNGGKLVLWTCSQDPNYIWWFEGD